MSALPDHLNRTADGPEPLFFRRPVSPELRGTVHSIVGYREDGTKLSHSIEMAPLVVPLIISFGDAFEIALGRAPQADETYASFTSGLYPGFVVINSTGHSQCIQVDFTPLGARRFFCFPMSEIANRMVPFADLDDRGFLALRERLGELNDWHARLALVERFVADRIRRAPPGGAATAWAWNALLAKGGDIRIGQLARHLGWSRKHLAERFRAEIGIEPKAVARMVRFNRAVALAAGPCFGGWADVAADCGYADQAHLAREFRELGGRSPSQWLAGPAR